MKTISKENTSTLICDILNHSQGNFVVESNKYPDPVLIEFFSKISTKSNPDPVHAQRLYLQSSSKYWLFKMTSRMSDHKGYD